MGSLSPPVLWRGLTAPYTPAERQIMRQLPVKEQAFVHTLKAFTDGEISGEERVERGPEMGPADEPGVAAVVYTDPEDIPFGKPKRPKKIYAVAWTWRKHKIHKTKKRCEERLRVWKRWYERQGWKVSKLADGYYAELGDQRHAIALHEYDRETKERL